MDVTNREARPPHKFRRRARILLPLLGISLVGIGLAVAPSVAVLAVACVVAAVVALLLARAALAWSGGSASYRVRGAEMGPSTDTGGLRIARILYYAGLLSVGLLSIRPVLNLTLSDLIFFAALVVGVLEMLANRQRMGGVLPGGVLLGVALFAAGGSISSLSAQLPGESLGIVARMVYITLLWFWLGAVVLKTSGQVRTAVRLWVVSAAITGGAGLAQLIFGNVIPGTAIQFGRMTGFTTQVNELGGITSIALVPALMMATQAKRLLPRLIAYGLLLLVGIGLVVSGSVSGMLAAAVGVLFWVGLVGPSARLTLVIVGAALAGTFLLSSHPSQIVTPLQRLNTVVSAEDASGTFWSRMEINAVAWRRIQASPVVGVGLDSESSLAVLDAQVHNSLLGVWYEAGLLGLLGLAFLLVAVIACGRRVANRARSMPEWLLAVSLFSSCLTWVIYGMANPVLYKRYGWIAAVLILSLRAQRCIRPNTRTFTSQMATESGTGAALEKYIPRWISGRHA